MISISSINSALAKQTLNFLALMKRASPYIAPSGAIGDNASKGFQNVSYQCNAEFSIAYGLLTGNAALISAAVTAFEYGFEQQRPEGSFNNPQATNLAGNLEANSFFLAAFVRSFLLAPSNQAMSALTPKFKSGATWLADNSSSLMAGDCNNANRLFNDAIAFSMSQALMAGDFLSAGVGLQNSAGWFSESGGYDSSYNGVSMLNIAWLLSIATPNGLIPSLARSAVWEASRISSAGIISTTGNTRTAGQETDPNGQPKTVDYLRVALGMMYAGIILDDPDYVAAGNAVAWTALK